jgi:hypothetical protein
MEHLLTIWSEVCICTRAVEDNIPSSSSSSSSVNAKINNPMSFLSKRYLLMWSWDYYEIRRVDLTCSQLNSVHSLTTNILTVTHLSLLRLEILLNFYALAIYKVPCISRLSHPPQFNPPNNNIINCLLILMSLLLLLPLRSKNSPQHFIFRHSL